MDTQRVLIVDQNCEDVCYQDFKNLKEYECQTAFNVESALRLIATNPPDLVVADVPNLKNGDRVVDLASKFNIPIIFASTFKNLDFNDMPKNIRVLNKPFRGIDLKFAVRSELAKREESQK